jgi:hypothetical protein
MEMDEIMQSQGLPIPGYRSPSKERVELVTEFKRTEERLLRMMEQQAGFLEPRWAAVAKEHFEVAFMMLNRAVFQPKRI